jgi:hypothetical protein
MKALKVGTNEKVGGLQMANDRYCSLKVVRFNLFANLNNFRFLLVQSN